MSGNGWTQCAVVKPVATGGDEKRAMAWLPAEGLGRRVFQTDLKAIDSEEEERALQEVEGKLFEEGDRAAGE